MRRHAFALVCGFLVACGGGGGGGPPPPSPITVALEPIASGLTAPVMLTHAGDGSGRRFVVEQIGRIRVIDATGTLLAAPFLDLTASIPALNAGFDERGLLGLAFHPAFATNGRFFVRYSTPRAGVMGEPCFGTSRGCHSEVLAEFHVTGDPTTNDVADPASEIVLLVVDKPQFNHNGGHVAFDPDGRLVFGLGDGGGAHDGLADAPPSHGPIGNGQNRDTVLGKILRLDVDAPPAMGLAYAIPPDNPFVGAPGADEVLAFGLRNPYRFSFDDGPGGTNALIVADVGQNGFEEVNLVVAGGNYGWARREGFSCFDPFAPNSPPPSCPTVGDGGEPLLDPVLVYDHAEGLAIVGGHVYRGGAIPALFGHYVFGDFSRDFGPSGTLFHAPTTGPFAFTRLTMGIDGSPTGFGRVLLGFGEDEGGELYVLGADTASPTGTSGVVMRLALP